MICEMSRKEMVEGLSITRDMNIPGQYEDCILGKHAACPYNEEVIPEEEVLEHIHIDMWGPASIKSVGGASYLMVLVDGGSAMKFSYPLSHKTGDFTLQVFSKFHVAVECVTGRRLLKVQIDGGCEWWNEKWDEYLCRHEITRDPDVTLYARAQNRVAERAIRTVIQSVRSLLFDAGLPKSLWAEAASCVIYVRGFVPSSRHPRVVLLER